jgi:hypothetical protein
MENVLPDVGREQQEQLDELRSVFRLQQCWNPGSERLEVTSYIFCQ